MKSQSQTNNFKWWTSLGIFGMALVCLFTGWLFALEDATSFIRGDALIASITFGAIAVYTAICQMMGWELAGYRLLRKVAKIAIWAWPVMFVCLAVYGVVRGDYWSLLGYFVLTTFYVGFPAFLIRGFVDGFIPGSSEEPTKNTESGRREILTPAPHTTGHTDP